MNPVIEAARRHYREQIEGGLKKYHVEEWGVDIHYNNKISYKDQSRLIDLQASGKMSDAIIETIILKCRKADGTKMFETADRQFLINEADPDVLLKIVNKINRGRLDQEELEKN